MQLLAPVPDASAIELVLTVRAGLLRRSTRELTVTAGAWRGSGSIDGRRFTVEVALQAASLRGDDVVAGAVSRLEPERHAELRLSGAGTLPDGGQGAVPIEGQLTIRGVTRPTAVRAAIDEQADLVTATGELVVVQTTFGVRPYAALLAGVEVGDEVRVRFRVAFRRIQRS